jgi:hypothetical protein
MSETKKRNVPTPEFKAKVGLEAVRGVKTINEIGLAFSVHPTQGSSVEEGDLGAGQNVV